MGFRVGSQVIVSDVYRRPAHYATIIGEGGTIVKTYRAKGRVLYAVQIDGVSNPLAPSGLYWFDKNSLSPRESGEEKEKIEMANSNKYKLAPGYHVECVVKCAPNSLSVEEFARPLLVAAYGPDHSAGEIAILGKAFLGGDPNDAVLARVVNMDADLWAKYDAGQYTLVYEVVGTVSDAEYMARRQKVEEAERLLAEMQKAAMEAQKLSLYETLAKVDPKMDELLRQYKALTETPEVIA